MAVSINLELTQWNIENYRLCQLVHSTVDHVVTFHQETGTEEHSGPHIRILGPPLPMWITLELHI